MKQAYADSIAELKKLYKGKYFPDAGHDLSHSRRDVELARNVAEHAGYEDLDLIELIAWWHDAGRAMGVDKGHEHLSAKLVREDLLSRGVDERTVQKVYDAIYYHSQDPSVETPTIEAKIFKDADKIDVHNAARLKRMAAAGWDNQTKADAKRWYANIPQYSERNFYEFEYSWQLAKKHIAEFQAYYDSIMKHL
jgi:HD superfamily phosphodiesterase